MKDKLITKYTYKDIQFELVQSKNNLRMFFNESDCYCIIVDHNNDVIFEIETTMDMGMVTKQIK